MNPSLIAQITQEVLAELGAGTKSATPSAPGSAHSFLVIATSAQDIAGALGRIQALPGRNRIVLAAPKYARNLLSGTDLTGVEAHYLDMGKPDECHLLAGADFVVLPTLDTPLLQKVTGFKTDTWPAKQVVNALAQNKKVFVPGKGDEPWAQKAKQVGILVGGWELLGAPAAACPERAPAPGSQRPQGDLAGYIDHTLLKPDATEAELLKLCAEARQFKFASVCVNPGWISLCAKQLQGSGVMVCTVVGFPLGATSTAAKVAETRKALADGADEIDMVLNIGALKSRDLARVEQDIRAVKQACGHHTLKVILETALLSEDEKVIACELSKKAKADFVKTSTGFVPGGATVADISLMRRIVGPEMGVKASGGVRDTATAQAMIAAGANRIGASASVAIATGTSAGKGNY